MKVDAQSVEKFLQRIFDVPLKGTQVHLFGSVARGSVRPSDVDLMISYPCGEEDIASHVRKILRSASSKFEKDFGIPMNLLVLSEVEVLEAGRRIGLLHKLRI